MDAINCLGCAIPGNQLATKTREASDHCLTDRSKTDNPEPKRLIPKTAKDEPRLLNDRKLRLLPSDTKSSMAKLDPKRDAPYKLKVEPRRPKLRSVSELPS